MPWFMAVIVRGSFVESRYDPERMGDLLYKLIEAPDAEIAHARAAELGQRTRETTTDEEGVEVTLRHIGLADLMEIQAAELVDGVEVYSEALQAKPLERVVPKEVLTAFVPWDVPDEATDEEFETLETLETPAEPGAERFRDPRREED